MKTWNIGPDSAGSSGDANDEGRQTDREPADFLSLVSNWRVQLPEVYPLRPRRFLTRKSLLCIVLVALAAAVYWYPAVDKKVRLHFAEKALRERDAEVALDWLRGVPNGQSHGQKEFLTARAYRRLGEMNLVREQIQKAYDQGFSVDQLQREQWLAMAQSGQMRDAEPHLTTLLQDPREDGPEICEAYVSGYFRNRQVGRAMPIIDAWQADYPKDPLPYSIRAGRLREMEQWPDAIAAYRKVLELRPQDSDSRLQLAICLKSSLKLDEAEVEFRKCLTEIPDDKILLAEWGDFLLSAGKTSEATLVFEQLLEIDPENFEARAAKGRILLANGESEEALTVLRCLHQEKPYDLKTQYSFASSLKATGRTDEAAEAFEQYSTTKTQLQRKKKLLDELDTGADPVGKRFEIAAIAMQCESPEEGLRWLMSVIDMDPHHQDAYRAVAEYYRKVGNAELEKTYRDLADNCVEKTLKP